MKRLIAAVVLGLAVAALPAVAADDAAKTPVKPAAAVKSMDPAKGSFHRVHTQKLKLSCDTCHATEVKDVLFLRGAEVTANGFSPVDRASCAGCHQTPAKPAWYGTAR